MYGTLNCYLKRVEKALRIDYRAEKEIESLPEGIRLRFWGLVNNLIQYGYLKAPFGKKLTKHIFEMRMTSNGAWRVLYSYIDTDLIMILLAFNKKTQKTPKKIINLATNRLKTYE